MILLSFGKKFLGFHADADLRTIAKTLWCLLISWRGKARVLALFCMIYLPSSLWLCLLCVFLFFPLTSHQPHWFPCCFSAQLCTRGPASHSALCHVCPANSRLGSKSWLMSHLLNDSFPNHSNPTLLVLLTPLFISFPYLWSSNILYNVLITTDYLLSVSPTECKHHKASELCLE